MRCLLALVLFMVSPVLAFAQDTAELSEVQRAYNKEGLKLSIAGEHAEALARFQNSLTLGEANVTWLNIGRSHQKLGQCMDAKQAYTHVDSAPAVQSPPPEDIAKFLAKYRSELPEVCPATVEVQCPSRARVQGGEWVACPTAFTGLPVGTVVIEVEQGDTTETRTGELAEGATLKWAFEPPVVSEPEEPTTSVANVDPVPRKNLTPIIITTVGGGLLLTAFILDFALVGPAVRAADAAVGAPDHGDLIDKAESLQLTNKIIIGSGATVVLIGVVWWMAAPTVEGQPVVSVGEDSTQVGWRWSW